MLPHRLLLAAALTSLSVAQEIVLPEHSYFRQGAASTLTWRGTAFHFQMVYDSTHLVDQGVTGPVLIYRLRFRAADGIVDAGGATWAAATVQMSSCAFNYSAAQTTFGNNRGPDNQVCYVGPVTTLPVSGATPNDAFVDLLLTNPFSFDPTLGADLVIEVSSAAPSGPVPAAAVTSLRSRRISAASTTAATGTTNSAASDVLVDFAGLGGYPTWSMADTQSNGVGCYRVSASFYEEFTDLSLFDLSNTTLTLTPNLSGGYDVVRSGPTTFHPHGPTHLGFGDDDVATITLPPGFATGFPFPTGSTTQVVTVCSNGFVYLGTELFADFPDLVLMLAWPTGRLAPFFVDLVPDPTNNVYFDVDPSGTTVYVTYDAIPTFTTGGIANLQLVLHANGVVEFRYGLCAGVAGDTGIVGWTPGNLASDPGGVDLSTTLPFATSGPDRQALTLFTPFAYIGSVLTEDVIGVPANSPLSFRMLAAASVPGVDLGVVGAPGCAIWIDPGTVIDIQLATTTPDATFNLTIPNQIALLGLTGYSQAAAFSITANAFGMVTSNQSAITFGNS